MKKTITFCSAAIILFAMTFHAGAEIIAGPIKNPANGHDYYLLSPNSWTMSEAEAESLGGTLAIIKNGAEQEWIFSKFGAYGGNNHNLWIGLHRIKPGGPFAWVNGTKLDYTNWFSGEPNNVGGIEDSVHMRDVAPGAWNDLADASLNWAVVELPGKADEISLSRQERALIGNWYEGGKVERPCWIAGTDNALFVISNNRLAARAGLCADGSLFAANFQSGWPVESARFGGDYSMPLPFNNSQTSMHGEIINDKILWSNGTWWSRKPVEYGNDEKSSDKDTDTKSADAQK
jgi:hypothetical protein